MPSVLVTGAARGIGRATALRLASAGWEVLAGVRRAEDGETLSQGNSERIKPVMLDVTDEQQLASLDDILPSTLDAVVNNAGIAIAGPLEAVSAAELRQQLEVNVVGQAAVTQAVLPRLRESRGRIVFVSSVSGRCHADVRPLQRVEVRARGDGRRVADGARAVGHSRDPDRTGADRHRPVAQRRGDLR